MCVHLQSDCNRAGFEAGGIVMEGRKESENHLPLSTSKSWRRMLETMLFEKVRVFNAKAPVCENHKKTIILSIL